MKTLVILHLAYCAHVGSLIRHTDIEDAMRQLPKESFQARRGTICLVWLEGHVCGVCGMGCQMLENRNAAMQEVLV